MSFRKIKLNEKNIKQAINYHLIFNIPFKIYVSNYTTKLESEIQKLHFIKKAQSRKMFTIYQKIKSELKQLPEQINIKNIKYYQTNFNYSDLYADKIYQIDIKSCYPNILLNKGLISNETFNLMSKLNKQDRLSSIGMLASKKNIFSYNQFGEWEHEVIQSEYSDYFFYCVQETYKIMDSCKNILDGEFLFSWVDAIYFTGGNFYADKIIRYLKEIHNLESSYNILREFEVELKANYYKLRYKKDGIATYMNIPLPSQKEKENLLNYLLTKKRKK